MIRTRPLALVSLALAGSLLLAGCASSHPSRMGSATPTAASGAMTPGMVMPDGSTMGANAPGSASASDPAVEASGRAANGQPSAAAMMVCSTEIRTKTAQVLALPTIPAGTSSWVDHVFTCTYQLPMGPLVLSVTENADAASTATTFAGIREQLGVTHDLAGLGQAAYGTDAGTVVLRKDNDILRVSADALPAVFGSQQQKRTDFAYEIASDVLGCWTGND